MDFPVGFRPELAVSIVGLAAVVLSPLVFKVAVPAAVVAVLLSAELAVLVGT